MREYIRQGTLSSAFDPDYDEDKESLDYSNMLAVCRGNEGDAPELLTCDKARIRKEYIDIPLRVNPLDEASVDKIAYSRSGKILSKDVAINADLDGTLNLNTPRLIRSRKAVLAALEHELARKCGNNKASRNNESMNEAVRRQFSRRKEKEIAQAHEKPPYAGILLWQLHKWNR